MSVAVIASLLFAVIPTLCYVAIVWWCDRYEKEPFWLLAAAFLWGAVPAILLAIGGEVILDPASEAASDLGRELISSSIVARYQAANDGSSGIPRHHCSRSRFTMR